MALPGLSSFAAVCCPVRKSYTDPNTGEVSFSKNLFLLESTGDGVHTYPLLLRLDAWARNNTTIVYRPLSVDRTPWMLTQMGAFVDRVNGKNYSFNPLRLLKGTDNQEPDEKSSYFCSELIAALYKRMGLLAASTAIGQVLPGDFAGDDLPLLMDGSLSPAILLQC